LVWQEGKFVELLVLKGKFVLNHEKKELRISRILSILASFLSWFKDKSSCQSLHPSFPGSKTNHPESPFILPFLVQTKALTSNTIHHHQTKKGAMQIEGTEKASTF